ncbi:leucine rich repeat-containing protein [Stylonychia lemnae]|uniref:Leucine rich repeat-containing protein n=1 Tax=Stylonychia lemnae TaxID=5949 RepID=A0A077ZS30_STYLE|nr:leucine rich repeat-containing protein [Stylonychia lemnae]|eukprot:CDW72170.1 leucine rich repeat-containing protein [Stylonychia lemnae]
MNKERSTSRKLNQSLDYSNEQQPYSSRSNQPTNNQPLGFFAQLQQSIFGSGQGNQNANQQLNKSQDSYVHSQSLSISGGKSNVQIFIDIFYKNYTRVLVQDETTAGEIVKNLRQKYANSQPGVITSQTTNTSSKGLHLSSSSNSIGSNSSSIDRHQYYQQSSASSLNSSQTNVSAYGKVGSQSKNQRNEAFKDEYGLFLINTKAQNPMLFVRKLSPQDYVFRIYFKALDSFKKDGEERFKLCFVKNADIETLIRSKGVFSNMYDEENHVVSQLGKSIINNKTYERKGKLYKKSLNQDVFKERLFVLDKDQLFYYKNEKQKEKNFNLIMLSNATIQIIQMTKLTKQKYCFEIENDNRKYILSTKSQYDLDQWVYAIQGQIRLSRDNKNIADVNLSIVQKEKEIAQVDMLTIQKIFKPKNVIFNPTQPILLDFIKDPFITELLPNLTKYVNLVSEKEYQRHALEKAKDIISNLKQLQQKLQKSLGHSNSFDEYEIVQKERESQEGIQLQRFHSTQVQVNQAQDDYKRYKDLRPEQKIQQIFSNDDFQSIDAEFQKMIADSHDQSKPFIMNPRLFNNILLKINRIIKYNYLEEFFQNKKIELLSVPTLNFKQNMPKMEFNATGQNAVLRGNKNINIFENILIKKAQNLQNSRAPQTQLDPAFQNQLKIFLTNLQQEQKVSSQAYDDRGNMSNISGISKVTNDELVRVKK